MNQSFYVNQNDPLTKKSGQIKFGTRLRLSHDRHGLFKSVPLYPFKLTYVVVHMAVKEFSEPTSKNREVGRLNWS